MNHERGLRWTIIAVLIFTISIPCATCLQMTKNQDAYELDEPVEIMFIGADESVLSEVRGPNGTPILFKAVDVVNGTGLLRFNLDHPPGTYTVSATSGNESANLTISLIAPDLALYSLGVQGSAEVNETITVFVHVQNNGTVSGKARISIYEDKIDDDYLITFSNVSLGIGKQFKVTGAWVPSRSGKIALIANLTMLEGTEWNTSNNMVSAEIRVKDPKDWKDKKGMDPLPVVLALITLGAIGGIFSTEYTRSGLIFLVIPAYMRLKRDHLQKQPIRKRLLKYIGRNSGARYSDIMHDLELSNGTMSYHLSILEREEFIKSIRDGTHRRYYIRGTPIEKSTRSSLTASQTEILNIIRSNPGRSQKELAKLTNRTVQTINRYIGILMKQDKIAIVNEESRTKKYVAAVPKNFHKCQQCGCQFSAERPKFCPNCGDRML